MGCGARGRKTCKGCVSVLCHATMSLCDSQLQAPPPPPRAARTTTAAHLRRACRPAAASLLTQHVHDALRLGREQRVGRLRQ
jgi:hypothetical protein